MSETNRKYAAEFIGTFVLVFFGVGSAVVGINVNGALGVALAFGLLLVALVYAIGPVSGCNINPAVTLGLLLVRRTSLAGAAGYWAAQILGGVLGGALLKILVEWCKVTDRTGTLGSNSWGATINGGGAFLIEAVLTALLVLVVLLVTGRLAAPGFAGLAIGVTLTAIHFVGIPLTGTGVNPARSIGSALFSGSGHALSQLWLFIIAPLVGAVLAYGAWLVIRLEDDVSPERAESAVAAAEVAAAGAELAQETETTEVADVTEVSGTEPDEPGQ